MKNRAVLVLAAGQSSRMKDIKQLLKINNKTLLEKVLETAQKANFSTIYCVLGANAEKIRNETTTKNIEFIFNKNYKKGLGTSIVAGIHHLKKEQENVKSVLILLADQPDVNNSYLQELIAVSQKNKDKIIASCYFEKSGVPAIFPKKYFDKLLLLEGDRGAKDFLKKHALETIQLKRKQPFKDLDTQEEYQSYLESI